MPSQDQQFSTLRARAQIIRAIRQFFWKRDFIETDTPSLVLSPGMEPHIRPIRVQGQTSGPDIFLPTSPEFAMKRILSAGATGNAGALKRIFQICKAYRHEPKSQTHNPEFTILEWYRADSGYESIMDDAETLFREVAETVFGRLDLETARGMLDLHSSWPRLSLNQCFLSILGTPLTHLLDRANLVRFCSTRGWLDSNAGSDLSWDDLFFLVMLNGVEPELAKLDTPVILYHYPPSQAALSNLETDSAGYQWAKRFEIYAKGLELANAFDELTDADLQRHRFEADMLLRHSTYGESFPANPIDEDFLKALRTMPPAGGIALGVDRMVMLLTGAAQIQDVLWQESHWMSQT